MCQGLKRASNQPMHKPPGDDPNYWMALTHQADAKNISKKVKRMLLDLNLASEAGGKVSGGGVACAVGVCMVFE